MNLQFAPRGLSSSHPRHPNRPACCNHILELAHFQVFNCGLQKLKKKRKPLSVSLQRGASHYPLCPNLLHHNQMHVTPQCIPCSNHIPELVSWNYAVVVAVAVAVTCARSNLGKTWQTAQETATLSRHFISNSRFRGSPSRLRLEINPSLVLSV